MLFSKLNQTMDVVPVYSNHIIHPLSFSLSLFLSLFLRSFIMFNIHLAKNSFLIFHPRSYWRTSSWVSTCCCSACCKLMPAESSIRRSHFGFKRWGNISQPKRESLNWITLYRTYIGGEVKVSGRRKNDPWEYKWKSKRTRVRSPVAGWQDVFLWKSPKKYPNTYFIKLN
jgi:hypothetical protein